MLNRLFLAPLLALSLAACASHTSVVSTPAVPHLAPATKVAAPLPVQPKALQVKSFSDKAWSVQLPGNFNQQKDTEVGVLNAMNDEETMAVFIQVAPFAGTMEDGARAVVMTLAQRGIDVNDLEPGTMAGMEAIVVEATKDTNKGKVSFKGYTVITQGHAYNFGCVVLPTADIEAAMKVCDDAAGTVKLNPLPPPMGKSEDGTSFNSAH